MDKSWAEVECMAQAASASDAVESDSFPTDIQLSRWQQLFNYSPQRSNLTRNRITDEHWSLVREDKEKAGHDRETYEHSLQLGDVMRSQSAAIPGVDGKMCFLVRLGGLLGTSENVRDIAGLDEEPKVVEGQSETGAAQFCVVDEEAKRKIEKWLAMAQLGGFEEAS
ncbi:hypothetical protein D0Z07_3828 [Hyphodiscus hymeniophilus]|uniref:Uncharacterized protein n=1 Tax=Hyphodiscus hymeniophilus TaxID=353542 RepID=A0A9P6VKD9_9HELO|nr:hypothetical protein D0Z07_3828 [Hyphodiscus hymeniophilus]